MQHESVSLPPDLPWALLDRYLANEVTEEERAVLEAHLRQHPAIAAQVHAFSNKIAHNGITDPGPLHDHVWQRVHARALRSDMANTLNTQRSQRAGLFDSLSRRTFLPSRSGSRRWIAVAATFGVIVAGAYALKDVPSMNTRLFASEERSDIRHLSTARGQRASIELTDGTRITLSVASTITVAPDFGERDRVIHLDGEALFDVSNSAGTPFIVKTATSSTRVLGTRFTVRQYSSDSSAITTVANGKVDVAGTVLSAGQRGLSTGDGHVTVSSIDNPEIADWTTGRISFHNVALQDVIAELNRWYDIEFALDDASLATEPITLQLHNRSADEVAIILNGILGTRYRKTGSRIVLTR